LLIWPLKKDVVVTVGFVARTADTSRWNGRLNFIGAAGSQTSLRTARTTALMSPPVARNTDAIAATCAVVGFGVTNHLSSLLAMQVAVRGWEARKLSIISPSLMPACPSEGEPAGIVTPRTVFEPQSWLIGLNRNTPLPVVVQPVSTRDSSAT